MRVGKIIVVEMALAAKVIGKQRQRHKLVKLGTDC